MKPSLFLLAFLISMFIGCAGVRAGFQPIKFEHDPDKEKPLDYRDGDWIPRNT